MVVQVANGPQIKYAMCPPVVRELGLDNTIN